MVWIERLRGELLEIERQALYRRPEALEGPQGVEVIRGGRKRLNFSSNDYLGLANHPEMVATLQRGASSYGVGAGAAHLVCGHQRAHVALEEALAEFTGRERALLFSTGYLANLGVVSALTHRGNRVFEDRLNHASLLDGARLSGARIIRYAHGDMTALEALLNAGDYDSDASLIASDGVFSMDGDLAPVKRLATLASHVGLPVMIDDAHGLGVLGPAGGGVLELMEVTPQEVPILMGTLGKAFGAFGAFVAGCHELIEYLIQRARTYIYTTAIPPAIAEAARMGLQLATLEGWRRIRLAELVHHFRSQASRAGLTLMDSATPIQPILMVSNEAATAAGRYLFDCGFLVGVIRPPTVPLGTARLRITLTALHEESHIDRLLEALLAWFAMPDQPHFKKPESE